MNKIPIYKIIIPEYTFEKGKPDFKVISSKIIQVLRKYYFGQRIALRFVSSDEHHNKSIDDLIGIIKKLGHDRYDPMRIGDRYENIDNLDIDVFALDFQVANEEEEQCVLWALDSFYEWPLKNRGYSVRINIGIIYDLSKLKVVEHKYLNREDEIKRDGFVFKKGINKSEAILGIIKIL